MKRYKYVVILLAFTSLFLMCSKNTEDIEADKQSITQLINQDTVWFNTNTTVDSTDSTKGYVPTPTDTWIIWWRGVQTHSDPVIHIDVIEDSAYVSWANGNFGLLNCLIKPPDTTWLLWQKAVSETAEVHAIFLRTGNKNDSITRGWRLAKISLASGKSDSVNTVRIDSLRIQSQSYPDLVIADPINTFYAIESLIAFNPAELVTITLYTNINQGEAFLHTFILAWPFYVRLKFNSLGNGTYIGSWHAQLVAFPRFAIFDLLNHSTLYTQDAKYDFNGWFLPYKIK
jgi:hypothetical protein